MDEQMIRAVVGVLIFSLVVWRMMQTANSIRNRPRFVAGWVSGSWASRFREVNSDATHSNQFMGIDPPFDSRRTCKGWAEVKAYFDETVGQQAEGNTFLVFDAIPDGRQSNDSIWYKPGGCLWMCWTFGEHPMTGPAFPQ